MAWNNDDYIEVKDRIIAFYAQHPAGRITTEIVEATDVRVTVKAYIYQNETDPLATTGHSWLTIPGSTNFTRGAELENAETSAVGRALALCGYEVKRSLASKDEIAMKQAPYTQTSAPQQPAAPTPLVQAAQTFGGQVVEQPTVDAPVKVISEPQRKRMFAISGNHNMPDETLKEYVAHYAGVDSSSNIPSSTYEALIAAIEAYVPTVAEGQFNAGGEWVPA